MTALRGTRLLTCAPVAPDIALLLVDGSVIRAGVVDVGRA